jgi:alpha-beta hydrolase superfamily lysophospholipase
MTRKVWSLLVCFSMQGAVGVLAVAEESSGREWMLVSEAASELNSTIHETVWRTSRPPGGEYDRIELHRYRGVDDPHATVLYLPGTNMNGEAVIGDANYNLWFFLAQRGVEVYALDYRTRFVPATGLDDLSFMRDWSLASFVEDAAEAAALIGRTGTHQRVFVAGFSRGVSLAYALAVSLPDDTLAGLIALDGLFKSHAPQGMFNLKDATEKFENAANFAIDVAGSRGWEWRQNLMQSTVANPYGPAQSPDHETVGEELSQVLYGAWGPGALANPIDGFSRPEVLAKLLAGYDRYYPSIQNIDGGSLADYVDDPNTPIDDGWSSLQTPVLYFGSTGMQLFQNGSWLMNGIFSAAKAGGKDFTIHILEGYGHLDVLVGENARAEVFEPILKWIEARSQ